MFGQIIVGAIAYFILFLAIINSEIRNWDMFAVIYWIDVVLSLIPAVIAYKKGRNLLLWWVYSWILFIVALIHSFFLKSTEEKLLEEGMKKCPFCAEIIKPDAKVCRYCGRDLP